MDEKDQEWNEIYHKVRICRELRAESEILNEQIWAIKIQLMLMVELYGEWKDTIGFARLGHSFSVSSSGNRVLEAMLGTHCKDEQGYYLRLELK